MADKPDYQNYEENPWRVDSARYKFAPWLIVHCRRTETYYDPSDEGIGSTTGTTTTSLSIGSSYPDTLSGVPTTFSMHLGYLNASYNEVQLNANFGVAAPLYSIYGPHRITKGIARYGGEFTPAYQMFGESTTSDSLYYYVAILLNMNEQPSDTANPAFFDKSRFSAVNQIIKVAYGTHTYSTTSSFSGQSISFPGALRVPYNDGSSVSNDGGIKATNKDIMNLAQGDFTIEGYFRQRDGGLNEVLIWNIMDDSCNWSGPSWTAYNNGSAQFMMCLTGPNAFNRPIYFQLFYDTTYTYIATISTASWVGSAMGLGLPKEKALWTHWAVERESDTISVYVHGRLKGSVDVSNKTLHYTR